MNLLILRTNNLSLQIFRGVALLLFWFHSHLPPRAWTMTHGFWELCSLWWPCGYLSLLLTLKHTSNLAFSTFLFIIPVILSAKSLQSQTLPEGCWWITWARMVHYPLHTVFFSVCCGFWVGYTTISKVCFSPDRLRIPYSMFKIAASTNQSKQPSLLCEMMKNINYVVFKQMVKSFLIRLQGPVCVYAHCKILVIPGSVGLYNVLHRFSWVVSIPCLGWGIWHRHTHIMHIYIFINYREKVKISAASLQKFSWWWKLALLSGYFLFHFPSIALSPFLGLYRNVLYI